MAVKIDLEKAYDKVDWGFLQAVLQAIGFSGALVTLIMYTVTSVRLLVIWNGEHLESFQPMRGIH